MGKDKEGESKKPLEFVPPTGAVDLEAMSNIAIMQASYFFALVKEGMKEEMAAEFSMGWLANMMSAALPRPYGESPKKDPDERE